jgi:hypothetical protein
MNYVETTKACDTARNMDNSFPTILVGGFAQEPINLEDNGKHDVPPSPDK